LSLCLGATKPRDLEVKGRELTGVHFAMVSSKVLYCSVFLAHLNQHLTFFTGIPH
jgi:hypothetical protein